MLLSYVQTVQGFTRDRGQVRTNPADLIGYVNRARREIAMRSQSVRILSPVTGAITQISVLTTGRGYTAPTVQISAPDFPSGAGPFPSGAQATAIGELSVGQLAAVAVTFGGDGYYQPTATVSDPHGSGATLSVLTTPLTVTQQGREVYPFTIVPLGNFPGVGAIYTVLSVAFLYNNYRYELAVYPFTLYQALIRRYAQQYQFVPFCAAQFGSGTAGSIYMYPIPQTIYQMEWDCLCLPADLATDQDTEAVPMPWQDLVPYFATHLAMLEAGELNAARYYLDLHDQMAHRYSAYARPGRITNPYGRSGF